MVHKSCIVEMDKAVSSALGRELSADEKADIGKQLDAIIKKAEIDNLGDITTAVMKGVDEIVTEMKLGAAIERRNALLNKRAVLEGVDYVNTVWGDAPAKGITAILSGVTSARQGSKASIGASQQALANRYIGAFVSDLIKNGTHKAFISGEFDLQIFQAMKQLATKDADLSSLTKEAVSIAQTIEKYNELARIDANKAGAFIKKLPGRVVKQTHDVYKIRAATRDGWKEFVTTRLDWDKSFPDVPVEERGKLLDSLYTQFAAGVHIKLSDKPVTGMRGFANIGKRMSHERVLLWNSPKAEFEYQKQFGKGTLSESMIVGLTQMAQNTAIMRHLGPNAEANLDSIIQKTKLSLKNKNDELALAAFTQESDKIKRVLWPNITGAVNIPGNAMAAQISGGVRTVESLAKMGGALLSSLSDIAVYGSEVRYQGGTMLGGMSEAIKGLVAGKPDADKVEILSMLGVVHESMKSAMSRFQAEDGVPGGLSKLSQLFFKLNGLTWWQDSLRSSFALASSHRLAINANKNFNSLGEDLSRVLGLYGIDADKWDVIRKAAQVEDDTRSYLTPEGILQLPDNVFEEYLTKKGDVSNPSKINRLREDITDELRSYFIDRATTAALEPDARTRSYLNRGFQPGTIEGEVVRHIGMFKSFTAAFMQKILAREIYGRTTDIESSFVKVLRNGNGELAGLANLIGWTTAFGFGSMVVKDLLKGKEPRDPSDYKTWMAAMVQGGGLGIYGDFLFGEMKNRFGGTPLDTLLGPTAGNINSVIDLFARVKQGDDVAASTFKLLLDNTPFINLFYTKAALDYLILYGMSEKMSPGYLRRMEKRVKEENNQTFLFPPSQNANRF